MENQNQTRTHWKKLTNPNYLGAYSLNPGQELIVTIERVVREMVKGNGGKQEECTVMYLKGQKPMILNKTNQKIISKVHGTPYIEEWAGKSITLYAATVDAFGERTEALRIREYKPVVKLPDLLPDGKDWDRAKKAIADNTTSIDIIKGYFSITPENELLLTAKA